MHVCLLSNGDLHIMTSVFQTIFEELIALFVLRFCTKVTLFHEKVTCPCIFEMTFPQRNYFAFLLIMIWRYIYMSIIYGMKCHIKQCRELNFNICTNDYMYYQYWTDQTYFCVNSLF